MNLVVEKVEQAVAVIAEDWNGEYNPDLPLHEMIPNLKRETLERNVVCIAENAIDEVISCPNTVELPVELDEALEEMPFADWLGMLGNYANGVVDDYRERDEEHVDKGDDYD